MRVPLLLYVTSAQAGTHSQTNDTAARQLFDLVWPPACAGVTEIHDV